MYMFRLTVTKCPWARQRFLRADSIGHAIGPIHADGQPPFVCVRAFCDHYQLPLWMLLPWLTCMSSVVHDKMISSTLSSCLKLDHLSLLRRCLEEPSEVLFPSASHGPPTGEA